MKSSLLANANVLFNKKLLNEEINRALEPLKDETDKLAKTHVQLMDNFCLLRQEIDRLRCNNVNNTLSRWLSCSSGLGRSIPSTISSESIYQHALNLEDSQQYLPLQLANCHNGALGLIRTPWSLDSTNLPLLSRLPALIDVRELELSLLSNSDDELPLVHQSLVELSKTASVASRRSKQIISASAPTSRASSPPLRFHSTQGDEIDKTGFARLRLRSLKKAAQISQDLSAGVTIGPNATDTSNTILSSWSSSRSTPHTPEENFDNTLIPKTVQKNDWANQQREEVNLINESSIDEEKYCARRILAEIDRIGYLEAQDAKFRQTKMWNEFDRRTDVEIARKLAQQQEETLKRQQAKMQEMARYQEEIMKKQEEFSLQQEAKVREFSQKQEETRKKQLEAEQLRREKVIKKKEFFQKVFQNYQTFSTKYREVLEILRSQEQLKKFLFDDLETIKACHEKFNGLIAKCKLDQISGDDVACSQSLLSSATTVHSKAKNELAKIEEIRRVKEAAILEIKLKEKEKEEDKIAEKKVEEEGKSAVCEGQCKMNSPRFKEYEELLCNLINIEKTLANFMADGSLKKFRSDCQKAINVPANAISAHSSTHLYDKYKKLLNFLQKQPVVVSDKRISATAHPLGPLYALNYLAIKCVKLGELSVSSSPEAAYPIAAVVIAIWAELPEFGKLLLSHFYKASPYLIPAYWEQTEGETEEQYFKRLGFLYTGGEKEEMDKFLKRQSGIMRLYCAIIITSQNRSNESKKHPLPISAAWKWLTTFISIPPKSDISATLLLDMLEVTGHMMLSTYGAQFRKLLHLICISYVPLVEKVTPSGRGGPVTRLRGFLEGLITGKGIHPPKDLLPPNFW